MVADFCTIAGEFRNDIFVALFEYQVRSSCVDSSREGPRFGDRKVTSEKSFT